MPDSFGPVYEVTHVVDREIIEEFDAWLGQHIEEMLTIEGISRAASFSANDSEDDRSIRVSRYHFDSDADLEKYVAGPALLLRQSADDLFSGRFEVHRRVLHENQVIDGSLKPAEVCLNCGSALSGQYCADCGQRATSRLISIWQLLREAFGDLLELDSRLWHTLIPLAVRPGKLTRDYLEGRRARFMPPFRTYLVLSIVFFLVAFFDPREEFGFLFGAEADAPGITEETEAERERRREIRGNVMRALVEEGVLPADRAGTALPDDGSPAGGPLPGRPSAAAGETENAENEANGFSIRIDDTDGEEFGDCNKIRGEGLPPWLSSRLTPERLKVMCERFVADRGKAWSSKLLENVPAALIALLPIMALVLKALYPLSKRYYVEHVLFVVHYHAFMFLILSLQIVFSRLATTLLSLQESVSIVTTVAVSLYIPVYLFRAMRRVYGQRWLITAVKYMVLLMAYFMGLLGILGVTAVIAAFSI
jgi:hypothetical protein